MIPVTFGLFPGAKAKALTLSYDDGTESDRRLAELFDAHGIRATFHLNSQKLDQPGYLRADELVQLFKHHEVAAHSASHPFLNHLPPPRLVEEIQGDRQRLEAISGYPVRGLSYPFGGYTPRIIELLNHLGIAYGRTVFATENFELPGDFLQWHPTCHHNHHLLERISYFKGCDAGGTRPLLFYVWGHSAEFDRENNWWLMERFCQEMAHDPAIWYGTSIEIADYIRDLHRLEFSADCAMVNNPCARDLWVLARGEPVRLPGGALVPLA